MRATDLLSADHILLDLASPNRKALLQTLAAEAARRLGRDEQEVLAALLARERLGTTALGRGVALPHARLPGEDPPLMIFARLQRSVDFEARDEEPVDLVFAVLWPESQPEGFLPALSELCRPLRDPHFLQKLRRVGTAEEASALLRQGGAAAED
ncbi:PTS sugar transporter subunit IIA [Roseomonas sp. F4]